MKNYGPVQMAKDFNKISESSEISIRNTEATARKRLYNNNLYREGYEIGIKNGDIDGEVELVQENGKMIPKNEHRNFKAGYRKGLEDYKNHLQVLNSISSSSSMKRG